MSFLFFLALLALPVLEIISVVQVSRWIGLLPMLLALGVSAAAGLYLIRSQSLRVSQNVMQAMRAGTAPEKPLLDAAVLNFAGILLIIPGFFTDLLALLLLIPATRRQIWRGAAAGVRQRFQRYGMRRGPDNAAPQPGPQNRAEDVIDVEFTEVPPEKANPHDAEAAKKSPWRKKPQ